MPVSPIILAKYFTKSQIVSLGLHRAFVHFAFWVATFVSAIALPANAESTHIQRVSYCKNGFIANKCWAQTENELFPEFAAAGVSDQGRRNMYISILNQPDKEDVRKVVVISAGQQTEPRVFPWKWDQWGDGYPNVLTGQPDNFKDGCKAKNKNCWRSIHSNSLAAKMRASGKFDNADTLFILAHDIRFGYFRDSAEKNKRENAWWNFLTSKFNPAKVDMMFLAGQSRGGCMMFRLARRFRATEGYSHIPLALHGYDAVCTTTKTSQRMSEELPMNYDNLWVYNPLSTSGFLNTNNYRSASVRMDIVFPESSRDNLSILNIHGGDAISPFNDVRSLTWREEDTDLGWWRQKWVDRAHNEMGGNYDASQDTIDIGFPHLMEFCARMEKRAARLANLKRKRIAAQPIPIDFDGDRLSDVFMRYQDATDGLQIRTRMSNGDGTYRYQNFSSKDGSAVNDHPALFGYIDEDRKTDIVLMYMHPSDGLTLHTKLSNGDGTFRHVKHVSGDEAGVLNQPAFMGDVDRDGLSDIIFWFDHPQDGPQIRVKFSNGDGTYRNTEFTVNAPDYPLTSISADVLRNIRSYTLHLHAADINRDNKTDLISHYWHPQHGFLHQTHISNGDGTFEVKQFAPGGWHSYDYFHSLVADVNRDRRSDFVVIFRYSGTGELHFKTFIGKGDGTFDRVITTHSYPEEILDFDAMAADVNGDRRTDIVLRSRDESNGTQFISKISNGDGTYNDIPFVSGDGSAVDNFETLVGDFDGDRSHDLMLRFRDTNGALVGRTKIAAGNAAFGNVDEFWGDGSAVDLLPAFTGPIYWSGGGTFPPCRTQACFDASGGLVEAELAANADLQLVPSAETELAESPVVPDLKTIPEENAELKSGASKSANVNTGKSCDPLVDLGSGNFELTCEISVTASGQNPNDYIYLVDLFGGQNPNVQPLIALLPNQTSFSYSDPWTCASNNPPLHICHISVADLNAAGGTSTITSVTNFQKPDAFQQAFNCIMTQTISGASKSDAKSLKKFSTLGTGDLAKSANPSNPSSALGDICVVVDLPVTPDLPSKLESVSVNKRCAAPTQGTHNGASGYFWNCTINASVQPTPFQGTFTLNEDASNISVGQAEFVTSSVACNGIGSDMLSCEFDGATMSQPEMVDVQLFTEVVAGKEPIKWRNCVGGRAETSVATIDSGNFCVDVAIEPEIVTDPPKLPDAKEVAVKKACESEPVLVTHNGVEGMSWSCDITVVADPAPFAGDFTLIEDASNISGTSNGEIIALASQNTAWNCASNLPSAQTSCDISGADFDASGEETLEVTLLAPTGKEPVKWDNCVGGIVLNAEGEKREVKGNCETISWKPPVVVKDPPKLSLKKSCVGPTAFGEGQRYICTIAISNTGGPVTDDMTLEELFANTAGAPATDYLLQLQGSTGWACASAPYPNGATCGITAADFNANNGHQISGMFLLPNNVLAEQDFENCAALKVGDKPIAEAACVPIDEPIGQTTFDVEKVCKPSGPRQTMGAANTWIQPYTCDVTVTTNGVPFTDPIYVQDVFSYGPNSGSPYVGQGTSIDNWDCTAPPFVPLGQSGNQPFCGIQGNDFPHSSGTSTITFPMTVLGVAAAQTGAENCGNLYTSAQQAGTQQPEAQSCVTIIEAPVVEDPTLSVNKVCSPAVAAANGSGPWTVSCNVTVSGTNLPAGQPIRITDELTGAGSNNATSGQFNQSQWVNNNCGFSPVANGIGTACDITTDAITNAGGSITLPYTGTLAGPGGQTLPDLKYPQNCAFASIPGIGLNAPASGKVCVQIPIEPKAIGSVFNDDLLVPDTGGGLLEAEDGFAVANPNISIPIPDEGGVGASCSLNTLYVVDNTGSMNHLNRLNQTKAALIGAYAAFEGNGSASSLITFKNTAQTLFNSAQVLPSQPLIQATQAMTAVGNGNWAAGFSAAANFVNTANIKPLVFFITDGNENSISSDTYINSIRSQGSRIIGIAIGSAVNPSFLSAALGPNVVFANAVTPIDPLSTDVIMINNPADSLAVFKKIEDAYCPDGENSSSPALLAAQKLLQNIPVSTQQYAGDDEPLEEQAAQEQPKPTVQPQLVLEKSSAGQCSINRGNQTYECPFDIEITNTGNQPYLGPLVMVDDFGKGGLNASRMSGRGWQLEQYNKIGILGLHGNLVLAPGQATNIKSMLTVRGQSAGGQFENCAILGHPNVETDAKWATMLLQQIMNARGFNVGAADGKIGPNTLKGLARLREQLGLPASERIDRQIFEKLGLGRQLAGTQSCATVPLPPMPAKITPPPLKPEPEEPEEYSAPTSTLTCDLGTTVKRGDACVCRFSRMLQTSATSCGCIRGHELVAGEGCFRPANDNPPPTPQPETQPRPIPPTLTCDRQSTRQRGNACVCKIPGGVMVSRTQCACPQGTRLDNREGCVKVETPRPRPVPEPEPKPDLKCDLSTSKADRDRCVCLYDRMTPVSATSCACPSGTELEAGIGCIGIGRPQKPNEDIKEERPRKRVAE